jgi:AcrR family transcriptional regulator
MPGNVDALRERPLRRDAEANRERLLVAARQVFDAHGLGASVAEIARVAGLGMGTLYRRFPTKDALINALVDDLLDGLIRIATDAARQPDGAGLERFLEDCGEYLSEHPGCLLRLWSTDNRELVEEARGLIAGLLAEAQGHRRIRAELTTTDITLVMFSIRGVLEETHEVAPDAWRRHLDVLLAGMRPGPTGLPHDPLSRADLDRILARSDSKVRSAVTGIGCS